MPRHTHSPRLGERFEEALGVAARLHRDQIRKGDDIPYISHLLAVASLAIEAGADEDEAIAALLHDAVEDQGGQPTLARIRRRFGDRVAELVAACTDSDVEPKPPWRARKEAYLAHLRAETRPGVLLVSISDKLHNARSILTDLRAVGDALWARFNAGEAGTLWYYRALVEAYRQAPARARIAPLIERLDALVSATEALTKTG